MNDIHLQKKIGKQKYYYDSHKAFELVTKAVKGTNEKLFKENQSTTKAIEELNYSNVYMKALGSTKRSEVFDRYL